MIFFIKNRPRSRKGNQSNAERTFSPYRALAQSGAAGRARDLPQIKPEMGAQASQ
ncbi:MAG TPA: hypothetical protein PKW29_09250 [Clostridia bacterium]|nr:hypothetical protein [Clostridia bacterium]